MATTTTFSTIVNFTKTVTTNQYIQAQKEQLNVHRMTLLMVASFVAFAILTLLCMCCTLNRKIKWNPFKESNSLALFSSSDAGGSSSATSAAVMKKKHKMVNNYSKTFDCWKPAYTPSLALARPTVKGKKGKKRKVNTSTAPVSTSTKKEEDSSSSSNG